MMLTRVPRTHFPPRAQRINLWGIVSASLQLENGRQLTGKLQTLSVTGGLLDIATYVDERTEVSLLFRFGEAVLQTRARMLFPMRGGMGYFQPFQFTSIGVKERQVVDREITERLRQNVAPEKQAFGLGGTRPRFYLDSF
jgi:hypothetical protein